MTKQMPDHPLSVGRPASLQWGRILAVVVVQLLTCTK